MGDRRVADMTGRAVYALPVMSSLRGSRSFAGLKRAVAGESGTYLRFRVAVGLGVGLVWGAVVSLAPLSSQLMAAALVALFTMAVGGVRRGQDVYVKRLGILEDVVGLAGGDRRRAYWLGTSPAPLRTARLASGVCLLVFVLLPLARPAGGAAALPAALVRWLLCLLPLAMVVLRELTAHTAVWLRGWAFPQYWYVVLGFAAGGLWGLFRLVFTAGASLRLSQVTFLVVGLLLGLVICAVRLLLPRLAAACVTAAPVPAWLWQRRRRHGPLAALLVRSRGRERSVLITGFSAVTAVLLGFAGSLWGWLPSFGTAYARPELTGVIVYAVAFMMAYALSFAFGLSSLYERLDFLRLAGVRPDREAVRLAAPVFVGSLVLVSLLVGAMRLSSPTALARVPLPVLGGILLLVCLGAVGASGMSAVRGSSLDAVFDQDSAGPLFVNALVGLAPLMLGILAIGYFYRDPAARPATALETWAAAGVLAFGLALTLGVYLFCLRRMFAPARSVRP